MRLRIATFNVENLSSRWRAEDLQRGDSGAALAMADIQDQNVREGTQLAVALAQEDDKRQMTALAIAEAQADLWMLQGSVLASVGHVLEQLDLERETPVHLLRPDATELITVIRPPFLVRFRRRIRRLFRR